MLEIHRLPKVTALAVVGAGFEARPVRLRAPAVIPPHAFPHSSPRPDA